MIKATVTLRITGPLQRIPIQLKNHEKNQEDYSPDDVFPKNRETHTWITDRE